MAELFSTFLHCHSSHTPRTRGLSSSYDHQLSRDSGEAVRHQLGHNRGLHGGVSSSPGRHVDTRVLRMANNFQEEKKRNRKGHNHQRTSGDPGHHLPRQKMSSSAEFSLLLFEMKTKINPTHMKYKTTIPKMLICGHVLQQKSQPGFYSSHNGMSRRQCVCLSGYFVCPSVC